MLYICEYADRCEAKNDDDWDNDLKKCDHCFPHEHNVICDDACEVSENGVPDGMKVYCVPYIEKIEFIEVDEMEI